MLLNEHGQELQTTSDLFDKFEKNSHELQQEKIVTNDVDMNNTPKFKIPIFVGINDKEKLDQVLEILKDDNLYEVAIISPSKYKELLIEYQFSKMTKEQQDNFNKFKTNELAKVKFHELAVNMYENGYKTFDRNQLKQFIRLERKRVLSNKEADDMIDCLFAFKEIEIINTAKKNHERNYMLLITTDDEIEALELKQSAIKNEINILYKEKNVISEQISKLKNTFSTQEIIDPINNDTSNLSRINNNPGQKIN